MSGSNPFVTIKTVAYAHELTVIRAVLEANDIICFAQDELTIQMDPFYSNALGGVKLQVRQNDWDRASELLIQGGYSVEKPAQELEFKKFRNFSSQIPIFRSFRIEVQLIVAVSFIFALIALLYFLFFVE